MPCRIIEVGLERAERERYPKRRNNIPVQWFVFSTPLLVLIFIGRGISMVNLALCKFYLNSVLKGRE